MRFKYEPSDPWGGHVIVDLKNREERKKIAKKMSKANDNLAEKMLADLFEESVLEVDLVHLDSDTKYTKENLEELSMYEEGTMLINEINVGLLKGFPLGKTSKLS